MGISIREYAKHRGCHHSSVQEAIASGRIRLLSDGTIDAMQADKDWSANTNIAKSRAAPVDEYRKAQTMKVRAEAGSAQFDLKVKMGQVVETKVVISELYVLTSDLMSRFASLGRSLMPRLIGETDLTKGIRIIDEEVLSKIREYQDGCENRILKRAAAHLDAQDSDESDSA
jgi:hypothetical protein